MQSSAAAAAPSRDFGGGSTSFEAAGETVRPQQGEMLSHFGRVRHAGEPTTEGTRYVLVGFVRARPLAAAWREIGKEEAPPEEESEIPSGVLD